MVNIRQCQCFNSLSHEHNKTFHLIVYVQILQKLIYHIIHIYSGITSGRVLNGELLYTKILEVNLFAFAYRLFHRDFTPPIHKALPN